MTSVFNNNRPIEYNSYMAIRFIQSLSTAFLNSDISKCSVTFVRCGGIFNVDFNANLLTSLPVKEL